MHSQIRYNLSSLKGYSSVIVWFIWSVLLFANLVAVKLFGHNIPLAEDWTMVAPLTGHEPHFWQWLWSQNNEHRLPLPRLIFLGLLKMSGGDFRSGMVYNVLVLAAMSAASIWVVKRLNLRKTCLADAVFPLALMHWGHWPNLFWSWQLSFVTPSALIYFSFLTLLQVPLLSTPLATVIVGLSAVLLPLCGAIGLIFMPFFIIWLSYCGYRNWQSNQPRLGLLLYGFATAAATISGLYFIGYEKPYWNPPSPGIIVTLATTAKFIALGLGPIAEKAWPIFILVIFGFLALTTVALVQTVLKKRDTDRSWGIFLFSFNLVLLSVAMGYGRSGLVATVGLPMRYVLFSVFLPLTAYFIWELYSNFQMRRVATTFLLVTLCFLLPLNTAMGFLGWGSWYIQGMQVVEKNMYSDMSIVELANQHGDFLVHWWNTEKIIDNMIFLEDYRKHS